MNFPQTLAIAQLCPYHGGAAVYTARFFVSFINDNMEYDDQTVCLQQGILRAINPLNIFANLVKLELKPNPASSQVEIDLVGFNDATFSIYIYDINEKLFSTFLNLNSLPFTFDTKNYSPGVYIVKVEIGNRLSIFEKLVIIH